MVMEVCRPDILHDQCPPQILDIHGVFAIAVAVAIMLTLQIPPHGAGHANRLDVLMYSDLTIHSKG